MTRLDERLRRGMARHGGRHVRRPLNPPMPVERHPTIVGGCGVYVVLDSDDRIVYVGSVHRPNDPSGISRRLREHLAEPLKALRWRQVWVIVVDEDCGRQWVRTYEAVVGAELAPTWNERLPTLVAG